MFRFLKFIWDYTFYVLTNPAVCRRGGAVAAIGGAVGSAAGAIAPIASAASSIGGMMGSGGGSSGGGGGGTVSAPEKSETLKKLEDDLGLLGTGILDQLTPEMFATTLEDIDIDKLQVSPEDIAGMIDQVRANPQIMDALDISIPIEETQLGAVPLEQLSIDTIQEMLESGTGQTQEMRDALESVRGDISGERQNEFEKIQAQIQASGQKLGSTTGQTQQNIQNAFEQQAKTVAEQERLFNLQSLDSQQQAMNQTLARGFEQQRFTGAREESNLLRKLTELQSRQSTDLGIASLAQQLYDSNLSREIAETQARRDRPFKLLSPATSITVGQQQAYEGSLLPALTAQQMSLQQPTGGYSAGYGGGGGLSGLSNIASTFASAPSVSGGGGGYNLDSLYGSNPGFKFGSSVYNNF